MFFELLSFAIVSTTAPTNCAESLSSFQRLYIQSALPDRQERIYGNVRSAKWAFPNLPSRSRIAALNIKIFEPLSHSEQSLALVERIIRGRRGGIVRSVEGAWKASESSEIFEGRSVLQFDDIKVILSENGQIADVQLKKKSWIRLPQTVTASVEEDYIVAMRLKQKNNSGEADSFSHVLMRASDDKRLSQAREFS
ncbi:MAG: hypothetical protein GW914_01625, partial [Candidatus Aenigmarchaeota archaeon]|nr:hypothetical protein [Candidatus Aenigmarchaeota archaeon]